MGIISGVLSYISAKAIQYGRIIVTGIMKKFYEKSLKFLNAVANKITSKIRGTFMGAAHSYRRKGDKYQTVSKNYSLDREIGEWFETAVVKEVLQEDIPPKYLLGNNDFEIDDTCELNNSVAF